MSDWIAIAALAVVAGLVAASMMGLSWLLRPSAPTRGKRAAYESGEVPTGESRNVQFNVQYYRVALLFVVFDVELAFIIPWAVAFDGAAAEAGFLRVAAPMAAFLFVLVAGLAWAWQKDALEWTTAPPAPESDPDR